MSQNLAQKYSAKVVERFSRLSLTDGATNNDYDWDGVTTVNVYSVATAAMGNYTRSGTARYGTITEVDTTLQTLTLTRDRSFISSIDKRNSAESQGVTQAGTFLARQVREVITPEIDIWRLGVLGTAGTASASTTAATTALATNTTSATTSTNAYANFLAINGAISDKLVPLQGRIAFITANYYNALKQSNYVLASEQSQTSRKSGDYGTVDGVKLVVVPSTYMPSATFSSTTGAVDLIITHPDVLVSPLVLTDYVTLKDPINISGWVVQGRICYDAFALTSKINAVGIHKVA
jgi:hypothetical protein